MKQTFISPDQLAALAAIADEGSFEGAANVLGVSTSAVSQRIRALEASLGRILVRRGTPSTVTDDGAPVLRHARQQALLAAELADELGGVPGDGEPVPLTVAVNADSLDTWFRHVLVAAGSWSDTYLQVVSDDEAHAVDLLRSGTVMAAVSTDPVAAPGCRAEPLGVVRYSPRVHPDLLERYAVRRPNHVPRLPVVRFDTKDELQDAALAAAGLPRAGRGPAVPSPSAFATAVRAGMGWGMLLDSQVEAAPELVPVPGLEPVERRLVWQRWTIAAPRLDRLTAAVQQAFPG
ncbi:LysR family transcriptional regulator (chromosome initiation inhibitor) [Flavimobilis soli]|uniref:LysR family transcriptional regulator (Chromosome initiation inhibitor) n=1 Tax=Flavimobilis soli TaxID=442709 RepID=A0A2A9EDV3_9MICO|nr:ArgP/LysG family DNA-binding transcriptional regulator [Flavimobilis soli]PFG36741.1 LysR family transcriptional regulator (chromosome initiation inhibitor) [Flavimobilis soli]